MSYHLKHSDSVHKVRSSSRPGVVSVLTLLAVGSSAWACGSTGGVGGAGGGGGDGPGATKAATTKAGVTTAVATVANTVANTTAANTTVANTASGVTASGVTATGVTATGVTATNVTTSAASTGSGTPGCNPPAVAPSNGSCVMVGGVVECNPVTNEPCAAGEACDVGMDGFECFPPPNTEPVCAACDPGTNLFCQGGLICAPENRCSRYCCSDQDCGDVPCGKMFMGGAIFPGSPELGLCGVM